MRTFLGAALAAALLSTGCGSPTTDPVEPGPAEVEAQAKADVEAEALELAIQACYIYLRTPFSADDNEKNAEKSDIAADASKVASAAAYLDPRWRTLADAFPLLQELYDIRHAEKTLSPGEELTSVAEQDQVGLQRYLNVAFAECQAAAALQLGPPFFPEYDTDSESDTDGS